MHYRVVVFIHSLVFLVIIKALTVISALFIFEKVKIFKHVVIVVESLHEVFAGGICFILDETETIKDLHVMPSSPEKIVIGLQIVHQLS